MPGGMPKSDHEAIAEAAGDGSAGGTTPRSFNDGQYLRPMPEPASVKDYSASQIPKGARYLNVKRAFSATTLPWTAQLICASRSAAFWLWSLRRLNTAK